MAAARQGLPVRLDRAPQRGAAFALTMRANARGKWPDQTLDQAFGLPEVLVAVSTSRLSCKRAGRTRTLMPVGDSSGESRSRPVRSSSPNGRYFRSACLRSAATQRGEMDTTPVRLWKSGLLTPSGQ